LSSAGWKLTGGLITGLVVMHEAALLALLRRWQGFGPGEEAAEPANYEYL